MTVKHMKVGVGKELVHFGMTDPDLCIENPRILNFLGWTLEADEDWDPNMFPTATKDVDLYGQYIEFNTIMLDGNGGIFRMLGGGTTSYMNYTEGEVFLSDYEPLTMERKVKFGGWATDPNLLDPNVFEGETPMMELTEVYAL
ncbi:MAG: hypothetical protein IKE78_05775 [Erysipelotrichaceae bacterium]|nr:hypothetical protein [Erysipelotrichaceae bacterium]MBR2826994.1 hypothetical protein [Erysipelotrichaceae bacterium]